MQGHTPNNKGTGASRERLCVPGLHRTKGTGALPTGPSLFSDVPKEARVAGWGCCYLLLNASSHIIGTSKEPGMGLV